MIRVGLKIALIAVLCILVVWNIKMSADNATVPVRSNFDSRMYNVRRDGGAAEAADTLARLNDTNKKIIAALGAKYARTARGSDVEFLRVNYRPEALQEHKPRTTVNTSYVLNKGDAIKLCLRDPATGEIHDYNTLMFVNLHELSHLMDRQYGHGDSFWETFRFVLNEADQMGEYRPIDYRAHPAPYCGIVINQNPLLDA